MHIHIYTYIYHVYIGMALNVSADIQRAEAKQSRYGCIKDDGVLGCIQMGRQLKRPWFAFPSTNEARSVKGCLLLT